MADVSNLVMPKLGLTMTEGTVTEWRVQPGQGFESGQIVAVVETEKIANEVEAPAAGTMIEHIVSGGETALVGAPMARWSLTGRLGASNPPRREIENSAAKANTSTPPRASRSPAQRPATQGSNSRVIATPLARLIARDMGVDLKAVTGSGPGGRIKAADIEGLQATQNKVSAASATGGNSCFLIANVNANEMLTLLEKLQRTLDSAPPKLPHIACLAVVRALNPRPDANRAEPRAGIYIQEEQLSIGFASMDSENNDVRVLRCFPVTSLTEIVEASAHLNTHSQTSPGHTTESGSIVIADATDQDNAYVNFPIPTGYSATLSLGAPRNSLKPGPNEQTVLVKEIGLTLTYDPAAMNYSVAADFLGSIKNYLENPLRLLAS